MVQISLQSVVVYEILCLVSESLSQSVDLAFLLIDKILTTILNSDVVNAALQGTLRLSLTQMLSKSLERFSFLNLNIFLQSYLPKKGVLNY